MLNLKTYSCGICKTTPDQISHHKSHIETQKHKDKTELFELKLSNLCDSELRTKYKTTNIDDINGTDIVKNNNTLIKNAMYDNIMEKYELENNYVFDFYIYRRTSLPYKEYQPLRFIEDIIKYMEYMEDINSEFKDPNQEGNKIPTYIIDFFKNILNEIENCDENNKLDIDILLRYDNKRFFLEKMMKKLDNYVKRYLGLNNF